MAIYQPTNITPDVRSGLGLGVVDVTNGITVTWRITGSSALTAFEIAILANDAVSYQIFTTGKLTAGCPAYGTSSTGEIQPFSYTITAYALSGYNISNGNEYKLVITQYYQVGGVEQSIKQNSASVFIARATPTLSITETDGTALPDRIDTQTYSFAGQYTQAQNDSINWFEWVITSRGNYSVIYDSGKIYGTQDITCTYDGFMNGVTYGIQLTVQTENGVEVSSDWVYITAEYDISLDTDWLTAKCASDTDAVSVSWEWLSESQGTPTANINVHDGVATISGGTVTWNKTTDNTAFSFDAPWMFLWRGTYSGSNTVLFTITTSGGDTISINGGANPDFEVWLYVNNVATLFIDVIARVQEYAFVISPTKLYVAGYAESFPGVSQWTILAEYNISYTQGKITSIALSPSQDCESIIACPAPADALSSRIFAIGMLYGMVTFLDEENSFYLCSDWGNSGKVYCGSTRKATIRSLSLYRQSTSEAALTKIGDFPPASNTVYDYSARSQQGSYQYYLFGDDGNSSTDVEVYSSNAVSPCWWNWTLVECAATQNANIFEALAAYRFRLNIETNAMSNNNQPNLLQNFTPYPKVQLTPQNYKSGTLSALIGYVDWSSGQPEYKDTIALRDALYALSTTQNALFLKSRKGDLIRVRVSAPITMTTADATAEQTQTISLPWVEVGSAEGVSLYSTTFVQM